MKKIILIGVLFITYLNIFSQSDNENMLKYWHYRNRLQYFVIPGTKQGESEILSERNRISDIAVPYNSAAVGQHGVYFGYYLSMLATEYKLLINNHHDSEATKTLDEIDLALDQFINYMDKCENYWNQNDVEDGFFVRENMPCGFLDTNDVNYGFSSSGISHLSLFNKNIDTTNVWDTATHTFHNLPAGHPGYTDNIDVRMCNDTFSTKELMSQDEAIGVLQGLALIKKYCPIYEEERSKYIACSIITYIRNKNHHNNTPGLWMIYDPDGHMDQGPNGGLLGTGDASRYVWGFFRASKFFYNPCINDYNNPESYIVAAIMNFTYFSDEMLWQSEGLFINPYNDYNDDMKVILAAIGKSWHTGITITIGYCPICFHIPFFIQTTGKNINTLKSVSNAETFYLLLYELLNNKKTDYLSQGKALDQINSAPCEGPYNYRNGLHPPNDSWGGWSGSYRWRYTIPEQQGLEGGFGGNFNGLDFMVMYNLYQLRYGGIPYENYNNRYLTDTVYAPENFVAFNTITSTQVISSQTPPIVNYKAGEQIELKPGFHAQEGSTFHAYINKVGCGENFITDSTYIPPVDTLTPDTTVFIIPCDSMTNHGLSDTALVHFNGVDFDTTGMFNYNWDFGTTGYPVPTPSTSNIRNPDVFFPCGHYYRIRLILSKDSTDTTIAIADTIYFTLYKSCCDSSGSKMLTKKPENSSNYQVNVFPNPTTGIFNVSCSDNSLSYSIEVSDVIGNIIYNIKNANGLVRFDLSSKPKGIYFVRVKTSDKKIYYRKIIHN